ncbi:MAG: efflux RND transporter periplasmic adaptor subunit [Hyphomicrobiales bacterium]|nr:efflux RND transporter periplasmic adaptor subunit [Hyphomicrobiales bacterium]
MRRRASSWALAGAAVLVLALAGLSIIMPCAAPGTFLHRLGLPLDRAACRTPISAVASESEGTSLPLAPAVTVVISAAHDFVDRFFVSGTLVPRDEAMVGAQIDGLRIVELLADDGDPVAKDQVLARLDRSQLDALVAQNDAALARADAAIAQATSQIGQFEAGLAQAQAELDRARKLDVQIVTQATLDQKIAAFRTAQSLLAAGKSALAVAEADKASRIAERRELMVRIDRTEVRAPAAGIISRRTARLGAVALSASDALFRIITDGAVELEAEVPEQWLARLKLGMQSKIALPGVEGEVEGNLRLISEEVDKATRLGKVRIALPLAAQARIGSFASGVVIIARRSGVGVPTSAVTRADDGDFVQVVTDDRVELRKITTGIANARLTEIRDGLAEGETVVARAAAFLRSGDHVRPVVSVAPTGKKVEEAAR